MLKLLAWYDYVLRLATHAKATYYLFFLSMAESSFFPIPPDVMLAPMCLAQPNRAWRLAFVTTIGSVLGGMIGYGIGAYAFGYIEPILLESGYMDSYLHAVSWFEEWGFWAIFVAGFSPFCDSFSHWSRRTLLLARFLGQSLWSKSRRPGEKAYG